MNITIITALKDLLDGKQVSDGIRKALNERDVTEKFQPDRAYDIAATIIEVHGTREEIDIMDRPLFEINIDLMKEFMNGLLAEFNSLNIKPQKLKKLDPIDIIGASNASRPIKKINLTPAVIKSLK